VTDSPNQPDTTPEEAAAAASPGPGGEHEDAPSRTDVFGDAPADEGTALDDAVVTEDAGAAASAAARQAAEAASDDEMSDAGMIDATGEPVEAPENTNEGTDVEGDEVLDDGLDLVALADSDPRSKAELLGELVIAENKRDEYLDDLRRSHADFENYRRRILREGAAQRDAGKADLAGPLLEVLDDLDRTLVAADGSPDQDLAKGVALVASKVTTTLTRVGLERIDATGVAFDPNIHEAVQQQPADEPTDEPVVVQVLRPGYRLGQRTLRPAMVVVEQ
jgi:molecular chaperone GrpE